MPSWRARMFCVFYRLQKIVPDNLGEDVLTRAASIPIRSVPMNQADLTATAALFSEYVPDRARPPQRPVVSEHSPRYDELMDKVNVREKLARFSDHWNTRWVAE